MSIPVICQADGTRFTVEAVKADLTCTSCGSGDHLDLDESLEATSAKSDECPKCGAKTDPVVNGNTLTAKCGKCGWSGSKTKKSSRETPPWVGSRQASFETDPEMGQVKEKGSVKQVVRCSSCFYEGTVTATDPAQPVPPCPSCGSPTLSPGGSTLATRRPPHVAARKTAGAFQEAVRKGLMMGKSEFLNPGAMLPSSVYVVMEPGPNGNRPTDRKTSDRDEANRWAQELLDQYPNGFPRVTSRRLAKIAEIARGIRATNPSMPPREAHRVAQETVRRYPKIIGN